MPELLERDPVTPKRLAVETHYVRYDEPGKRMVKAVCGTIVRRDAHVNDPTCLDCQEWLREAEKVAF